ncbi:MAG: REP-associated tyrosine transposase [Sphingomonadales bacterium]|nr:REP-associated tyrosine transposase [Sphingomonadales bacterium]
MPRPARQVLPGLPHHVTQRGNCRRRVFFRDGDHAAYLSWLRHFCRKSGTSVWAWCLMPNHVHLILVPAHEDGLRAALAPAHTRYAIEINRRHGWCGHLWQGRFGSFPMDEAHLHVCLRYVELNPVRAGLAARPEAWPWSSARAHLGLAPDGLTDMAAMRGRIDDWRAFLDAGLEDEELDSIRAAERTGRLRLKAKPRR